MNTERLYRAIRTSFVFLAGFFVFACGKDNPDNSNPSVDEQPSVFNYSDPNDSGVTVVSYDNGTILMETTEDKIPNVGDYVCSGPTDEAPYGYLRKVLSVTRNETKSVTATVFKLVTGDPDLDEVFDKLNIDTSIPYDLTKLKIESVTDPEGNELEFLPEKEGWTIINKPLKIDLSLFFDGFDEKGEVYQYHEDIKDNLVITPTVTIIPKKLSFPVKIQDGDFKHLGIDLDFDVDMDLKTDIWIGSKYDSKEIPLFNIKMSPWVIMLGEVPFVLTPLFTFYYQIKAEGGVTISFKPVDVELGMHFGAIYDFEKNESAPHGGDEFFTKTTKKSNSFALDKLDTELKISGELRSDLGISFSVGAYGCNLIERMKGFYQTARKVGFNLADALAVEIRGYIYAQVKAQFSIKGLDQEVSRVDDSCSSGLYANATLQFFVKIFNIGWEPKLEPKDPLVIWEPFKNIKSLFISEFSEFKIETNHDMLKLYANKHRPCFGRALFSEMDYGFCYKEYDKENEKEGLHYISIRDKYSEPTEGFVQSVEGEIPLSYFVPGKAYTVYPYSQVSSYILDGLCVLRKEISFVYRDNGTLSNVNMEDVPGENL